MRRCRRRYREKWGLDKISPSGGGRRVIPKHPVQMKRMLCIQKERVGHPGRRDPGGGAHASQRRLGGGGGWGSSGKHAEILQDLVYTITDAASSGNASSFLVRVPLTPFPPTGRQEGRW
eukprot:gene13974-biopygen12604